MCSMALVTSRVLLTNTAEFWHLGHRCLRSIWDTDAPEAGSLKGILGCAPRWDVSERVFGQLQHCALQPRHP